MAGADDVELPDLQVTQQYGRAVRGATAPRAELVAALAADLEWLTHRRPAALAPVADDLPAPVHEPEAAVVEEPDVPLAAAAAPVVEVPDAEVPDAEAVAPVAVEVPFQEP